MVDIHPLPPPRPRLARRGPLVTHMSVRIKVVTPILGGSAQLRECDGIDIIRPATVRGHLRFWWRALHGHQYASAKELYEAESALWGRAATDEGGRSAVEIRLDVEQGGSIEKEDINPISTPGAYALWPARAEKSTGKPAPRRKPGTVFRLTLITPAGTEAVVRNAVRAWLIFGGYGSRTRRGLGSFTVVEDAKDWLPARGTRDAFAELFGRDIFASVSASAGDTPWLAGASLHVGTVDGNPRDARSAEKAWIKALNWLKDFRQRTEGQPGDRAREPGTGKPEPSRPSISNWPEADKIRHLSVAKGGLPWAHQPRHNAEPVWPRAGFGLPITVRFQAQSRLRQPRDKRRLRWDELNPRTTEPEGDFELGWRVEGGSTEAGSTRPDRLASPLIVKALPLADGTFLPCALWLNRAYPRGQVVVRRNRVSIVENSAAPFDRLTAPGETPRFSALQGKTGLRAAFLDWLHAKHRTTVVAP